MRCSLRETVLLPALACAALAVGCGARDEASEPLVMSPEQYEAWEIALVEMRIDKNEEFADSLATPLPVAELATFEGLNYYFPQRELVYRTALIATDSGDTVTLTKRGGQTVRYLKRGAVAFRHDGKSHRLTVYGPADTSEGDYLWLPFYDATSGHDTYAGGRYLDLVADDEGLVTLDFNYAYNPLCDYNPDRFNCTLPPPENTLPFAVEAGEKVFSGAH